MPEFLKKITDGLTGSIPGLLMQQIGRFINGEDWYQSQLGNQLSGSQNQQNAFNASEAEKSRLFNSAEAEKNRQFQLDFYNNYNSPEAMVRQYKNAGINPASMFGAITPQSASGGSAASSSPAAGSGASIGSIGLASMLDLVAQSQSYQLGKEQNQIARYNAETNRIAAEADANLKTVTADGIVIDNSYKDVFNSLSIDEIISRIQKNNVDVEFVRGQIVLNGVQVQLTQEQIELCRSEINLNNINRDTLAKALQYADEYNQAQIALMKAQTAKEYASASELVSQQALNMINHAKEDGLISDGYYSSLADTAKSTASISEKNRKWYVFDKVAGVFLGLAGAGASVAGATRGTSINPFVSKITN